MTDELKEDGLGVKPSLVVENELKNKLETLKMEALGRFYAQAGARVTSALGSAVGSLLGPIPDNLIIKGQDHVVDSLVYSQQLAYQRRKQTDALAQDLRSKVDPKTQLDNICSAMAKVAETQLKHTMERLGKQAQHTLRADLMRIMEERLGQEIRKAFVQWIQINSPRYNKDQDEANAEGYSVGYPITSVTYSGKTVDLIFTPTLDITAWELHQCQQLINGYVFGNKMKFMMNNGLMRHFQQRDMNFETSENLKLRRAQSEVVYRDPTTDVG